VISRRAVEGAIRPPMRMTAWLLRRIISTASGRRHGASSTVGATNAGMPSIWEAWKTVKERKRGMLLLWSSPLSGREVIIYRELFVEKDSGAFFAPANLPSSFPLLAYRYTSAGSLLAKGNGGHAEDKGVDAL